MATVAHELGHYQLPARIRARKTGQDAITYRLALAERIADLPGIRTQEQQGSGMPYRVDVYLQVENRSIRMPTIDVPLCAISLDGIEIFGLSGWDQHQVLRGAWGRLRGNAVLMHLPRDADELEVCWQLVQRARRNLMDSSDRLVSRKTATRILPSYSRTNLQ